MFFAEEDEKCFNNAKEYSFGREFVMPFVDAMGNEGFKLNKTRSVPADTCPVWFCCCCPMNRCCKCFMSTCCNYDNDQAELRGFITLT